MKEITVDVLGAATSLQRKSREVTVVDAMVVVSPKPVWIETCEDVAKFFLDRLDSQTEGYSEVKLVFDTYEDNSLKKATRKSRRHGEVPVRYKIEDKTNIKNLALSKLLSHDDTKQRLTYYFGKKAVDHYQQRGMP